MMDGKMHPATKVTIADVSQPPNPNRRWAPRIALQVHVLVHHHTRLQKQQNAHQKRRQNLQQMHLEELWTVHVIRIRVRMEELVTSLMEVITTTVFVLWDMTEHIVKRTSVLVATCLRFVQTVNASVVMDTEGTGMIATRMRTVQIQKISPMNQGAILPNQIHPIIVILTLVVHHHLLEMSLLLFHCLHHHLVG